MIQTRKSHRAPHGKWSLPSMSRNVFSSKWFLRAQVPRSSETHQQYNVCWYVHQKNCKKACALNIHGLPYRYSCLLQLSLFDSIVLRSGKNMETRQMDNLTDWLSHGNSEALPKGLAADAEALPKALPAVEPPPRPNLHQVHGKHRSKLIWWHNLPRPNPLQVQAINCTQKWRLPERIRTPGYTGASWSTPLAES